MYDFKFGIRRLFCGLNFCNMCSVDKPVFANEAKKIRLTIGYSSANS